MAGVAIAGHGASRVPIRGSLSGGSYENPGTPKRWEFDGRRYPRLVAAVGGPATGHQSYTWFTFTAAADKSCWWSDQARLLRYQT